MTSYSVIGKQLPDRDSYEKVAGEGDFVTNLELPNMLHAKILRSVYPAARIVSVDASKADRMPGVHAIVWHKDSPKHRYNPLYNVTVDSLPKEYRIFDDFVRYVGDRVLAVAAESESGAMEAIESINVEYEQLPAVFEVSEAMKIGASKVGDYDGNIARHIRMEIGDVKGGFERSDHVFEDEYFIPRMNQFPLEKHVCVVSPEPGGRLKVWSSTQSIFGLRLRLSQALGAPQRRITVVKPKYIGGGFGAKLDMNFNEPVCALLALKTNRPVRMEFTRQEEFLCTSSPPAKMKLKTGLTKEGKFAAREAHAVVDSGAYAIHAPTETNVMGATFFSQYKSPNVLFDADVVLTNTPPVGALRGYGAVHANFAVESQIDRIADELGLDKLQFRLLSAPSEGEINPIIPPPSYQIKSYGLKTCLDRAAKEAGWFNRSGLQKSGRYRRGISFAALTCGVSGTQGIPEHIEFSGAIVKLDEEGFVTIVTGCVDQGGGQNTIIAEIVAEDLGVKIENVFLSESDTDVAPFDVGTHASRVTYVVGKAAREAARDAKRQLLERGAEALGVSADELRLDSGKIIARDGRAVEIAQVVRVTGAANTTIIGKSSAKPVANALPAGAQFAEVEVDTETGKVSVIRIVAAYDVGRAISPLGVEGQVEGGIVQGMGSALSEEMIYDRKTGTTLTSDLLNYKVVSALEAPAIEVIIVETDDPTGPFGAKGVAEPAIIPTPAAIANAIYDAIGVRIRELPITPEKVLQGLGKLG